MKYVNKLLGFILRHQEFSAFDAQSVLFMWEAIKLFQRGCITRSAAEVLVSLMYIHLNNISRKPLLCMIYLI